MSSKDKRPYKLQMDAHSVEPAIVLRFVEEAGGKEQLKIIQLKGLNQHSDAPSVARFVLDQCQPLVPASGLAELEQLVSYLQKRTADKTMDRLTSPLPDGSTVSLEKLDEYMELLYEESDSKQRGISLLAELVLNLDATQLDAIVRNEPLMGALARTMKEEARRNFDLAVQLAQLFHRLSQFLPFHPILAQWKIGLISLQLVEHELRRWELWRQQMMELAEEQARKKWEFAMRKQDQLITVCLRVLVNLADDVRTEHKMLRKGLLALLFKALEHSTSPQLLLAATKFLWKLSQFAENQKQIADTAGWIEILVSLLSAPPPPSSSLAELSGALFSLLFNCSFEPASRRRMVQAGLVSLLAPHLSANDTAISLMYQLSIVDDAKAIIAFTDSIPTLMDILFHGLPPTHPTLPKEQQQQQQNEKRDTLIKSILLNIVLEKRNAQLLCGTDGQGLDALMGYALDGESGDLLAMKILRNIAAHEGPTREMFGKWMSQLLENATEKINPQQSDSQAHIFSLECMAICALIPEAPWPELDTRHGIVQFLMALLGQVERLPTPSNAEETEKKVIRRRTKQTAEGTISDDILLQAILLCGTLSAHSVEMAERVEGSLLPFLILTLNKRQEDDELVLQCAFAFVCLLSHGGELASRLCAHNKSGINSSGVVELLLNLMHDKNPRLRALCDRALQQIAEISPYWRARIQEARFRWHNSQWIEIVQAPDTDPLMMLSNNDAALFDGNEVVAAEQVLNTEELLNGTEF